MSPPLQGLAKTAILRTGFVSDRAHRKVEDYNDLMEFSDYVVYADESGDHSLTSINPQNPAFALVFCVFEKKAYVETVVPLVQRLKFDFFGHDCVVLHAHEIRKARGDFNILLNSQVRQDFIDRVNALIAEASVTVIAAVIDKQQHIKQYRDPANPYEIALAFCIGWASTARIAG